PPSGRLDRLLIVTRTPGHVGAALERCFRSKSRSIGRTVDTYCASGRTTTAPASGRGTNSRSTASASNCKRPAAELEGGRLFGASLGACAMPVAQYPSQRRRRRMSAFLEVWRGGARDVVVLSGERITIGKSETNDVSLPDDATVSRLHAVLQHFPTGWSV